MTAKLPEPQRALLEQALDELFLAINPPPGDTVHAFRRRLRAEELYLKAIAIVRERPAGQSKVRSDFNTKRPTPQLDIPSI